MAGPYTTVLDDLRNVTTGDLNTDKLNVNVVGTVTISGSVSVTNLPTTVDTNYGTVGASTIRTAAQIGNSTGAAAFNSGTTSAQTLRVVLPTDQTAIPASQSGSWTVAATQSGSWTTGRTWTLSSGTDSVSAAQSGTWNITNISGTISLPTGAATDSSLSTINTNITNGNLRGTVSTAVATTGGMTRFRNTALSNTATAVKASAGNLYYYHVYNSNAADAFLQLYNVAQGSVTVGTTTPDLTLAIPAGGVLDGSFDGAPFSFSTAITIAATTTITGGSAPSTGLLVAMGYA